MIKLSRVSMPGSFFGGQQSGFGNPSYSRRKEEAVGIRKSLLHRKSGEVGKPRLLFLKGYAQRSTTTFFWVKKSTASQL